MVPVVKLSPQMERLFHHCINIVDLDPPHVDDVDDLLSALKEEELIKICVVDSEILDFGDDTKAGPGGSISFKSLLHKKLYFELVDIEIELPENTCGFLREILGGVEKMDALTTEVMAAHATSVEGID